jgi:hypothetical protein
VSPVFPEAPLPLDSPKDAVIESEVLGEIINIEGSP